MSHPLFARFYTRFSESMEERGAAELRDRLLAGLRGRVVEIGAGNGLNFAHYPPEVDDVLAIEPEPYLRARAEEAASHAPVRIEVLDGVASRIPAERDTFDAAVFSLVLCTVPNPTAALAEVGRVLAPGGELRFFEHVRAERPGLSRLQRGLDRTIWPVCAAGCHTARDTVATIEATGYTVVDLERFDFPETRLPVPTKPHALGRALLRPREDVRSTG